MTRGGWSGWPWLVAGVTGLALVLATYDWARVTALRDARQQGQQRLRLYAGTIRTAIDRHAYLPFALAMDSDIRRLLAQTDSGAVDQLNRRLEAINQVAQSANIYVMDRSGTTLAASNWATPQSYVGINYGFRPYFLDAIASGRGFFYGVGLTTKLPGYFIAAAVQDDWGSFLGAVVIKIDLDGLERDWALAGEAVLVQDENGVAILSSQSDWRYRVEPTLDEALSSRLGVAQRYGDVAIRQAGIQESRRLDDHTRLLTLDDQRFVVSQQPVPGEPWQIQYWTGWNSVVGQARSAALAAGSAWAAICLAVLYLRQRRLGAKARAEAQAALADTLRRARDELEQQVAARTADLRAEMAERRRAQEELIHAGKMAALGQMSAAMAHEINQPLTALQTFLASTRIFLARGDSAMVTANFDRMTGLADRIARITQQLKLFARKSPVRFQPVDIAQAIQRSLELMEGQLRAAGVTVTTDLVPLIVAGDPLRLEQVFVNLLRNAIDAMAATTDRRLSLRVIPADGQAVVMLDDSGTGITADILPKLFEPFFTTKDVGEGLGLGLSLSYGIIRDMGGTIHAANADTGGARFTLTLPLQPEPA